MLQILVETVTFIYIKTQTVTERGKSDVHHERRRAVEQLRDRASDVLCGISIARAAAALCGSRGDGGSLRGSNAVDGAGSQLTIEFQVNGVIPNDYSLQPWRSTLGLFSAFGRVHSGILGEMNSVVSYACSI